MGWSWIVWFILGFIGWLIIPVHRTSQDAKGWGSVKHFLSCFVGGGLTLVIAIQGVKEKQWKDDAEWEKEREEYLEREAKRKENKKV
jgi:hypothetical protein